MESFTMSKGQTTVEFALLIVFALVFIVAVVQPNSELASNSINDVSNFAKLKISAEKLANAIQYVSISGRGTIQTIQLTIPENGNLECQPNAANPNESKIKITYSLKTGQGNVACENDEDATGALDAEKTCNISIQTGMEFSCIGSSKLSSGNYTATVKKLSSGQIQAEFW